MFKFNSLASKLTFIVCLLIAVILIVINIINYYNSKKSTYSYLEQLQIKTMFDVSKAFDIYAQSKRNAVQAAAIFLEKYPDISKNELFHMLENVKLSADFDVVYVGFEEDGALYQSNRIVRNMENSKFDSRIRPWYIEAKTKKSIVASDPYKSVEDDSMTISYAVPIYSQGKLVGVVGGDYNLHKFAKDVLILGHSEHAYTAIYDKEGTIIFHEEKDRMLTKNDLSINIANAIKADPDLADPTKEDTLFYAKDDAGKTQVATCTQALNPKYVICSITQESVYTDAVNKVLFQQIIIAIIAIILALILIRFSITKNLRPISIIT
ncbi:cache domain-containing protein, partial [Campylobacter insulaenigrae]|uniref:cache domain-containing protein n=1 Tax=Campylobacter insulaenigrae TaxID=260714 RepID=UPI002152E05E